MKTRLFLLAFAGLLLSAGAAFSQDPDFHIYLCLGQSNMEGHARPEEVDTRDVNERFRVMAAVDCPALNREKGHWYTAVPPLTRCHTGITPADYFGRTLVEYLPETIRVGVINVSVGGCRIELFDKENYETYVAESPDWLKNMVNEYDGNPYARLVETARTAQRDGVIKGILLHQGESNTGDPEWPQKVKKVYESLLRDLGLSSESVPLLAGEVVHADQQGVCASMNDIIATLPETIPTAHVISSAGCEAGEDHLHFTAAGYRELGRRYAVRMLSLLEPSLPAQAFPLGTKPNAHNIHGAEWPRVGADGRTYFRVYAPDAQKVEISFRGAMTREADGFWTYVSPEPEVVGFHYYNLLIDGVSAADPAGKPFFGMGRWVSGIEIPEIGVDYDSPRDVPHGRVSENWYFSKVTGQWRRCFVYTPAVYDTDPERKFPVLYLQHGMAEDETGWSNQGRMNFILDNLIADEKAVPMIVVMDSGNLEVAYNPSSGKNRDEYGAEFTPILLNEIIPYIESRFRTFTDRENRAMAGLSWGGFQTLQTTLPHPELFAYIGTFSGAGGINTDELSTVYNGAFADIAAFNAQNRLFFLGIGSEERPERTRKLAEGLQAAGITNVVYYESTGTAHEWLTWRRCLHEFAPQLFKK